MKTNHIRFGRPLAAVLMMAAGTARAEEMTPDGPCDDLVGYLREALTDPAPFPLFENVEASYGERESSLEGRLTWTSDPASRDRTSGVTPTCRAENDYAKRVTPACRAETRRGAAPTATAAARAWIQRPEGGWIDRGRILLCTMQDPSSLGEVAGWMDASPVEVRAFCVSALATWVGAEATRSALYADAVQRRGFGSEIDPAVVAAANVMSTPELREQLVPVLATAHERHALGYDRLRKAVCTDEGEMSAERTRACATLPVGVEREWTPRGGTARWLMVGAATATFAGAVTVAAVDRHSETGRAVATGAGVPMGAMTGLMLGAMAMHRPDFGRNSTSTGTKVLHTVGLLGGTVVGSVAGAWVARHYAASPGARAPVTAVGLAPVYLTALVTIAIIE